MPLQSVHKLFCQHAVVSDQRYLSRICLAFSALALWIGAENAVLGQVVATDDEGSPHVPGLLLKGHVLAVSASGERCVLQPEKAGSDNGLFLIDVKTGRVQLKLPVELNNSNRRNTAAWFDTENENFLWSFSPTQLVELSSINTFDRPLKLWNLITGEQVRAPEIKYPCHIPPALGKKWLVTYQGDSILSAPTSSASDHFSNRLNYGKDTLRILEYPSLSVVAELPLKFATRLSFAEGESLLLVEGYTHLVCYSLGKAVKHLWTLKSRVRDQSTMEGAMENTRRYIRGISPEDAANFQYKEVDYLYFDDVTIRISLGDNTFNTSTERRNRKFETFRIGIDIIKNRTGTITKSWKFEREAINLPSNYEIESFAISDGRYGFSVMLGKVATDDRAMNFAFNATTEQLDELE